LIAASAFRFGEFQRSPHCSANAFRLSSLFFLLRVFLFLLLLKYFFSPAPD